MTERGNKKQELDEVNDILMKLLSRCERQEARQDEQLYFLAQRSPFMNRANFNPAKMGQYAFHYQQQQQMFDFPGFPSSQDFHAGYYQQKQHYELQVAAPTTPFVPHPHGHHHDAHIAHAAPMRAAVPPTYAPQPVAANPTLPYVEHPVHQVPPPSKPEEVKEQPIASPLLAPLVAPTATKLEPEPNPITAPVKTTTPASTDQTYPTPIASTPTVAPVIFKTPAKTPESLITTSNTALSKSVVASSVPPVLFAKKEEKEKVLTIHVDTPRDDIVISSSYSLSPSSIFLQPAPTSSSSPLPAPPINKPIPKRPPKWKLGWFFIKNPYFRRLANRITFVLTLAAILYPLARRVIQSRSNKKL